MSLLNMTREKRMEYAADADRIVKQMTLEEKVSLMSGDTSLQKITEAKQAGFHFNFAPYYAGGNQRFHVPTLRFCDGPRGVVCEMERLPVFLSRCCGGQLLMWSWKNRLDMQSDGK